MRPTLILALGSLLLSALPGRAQFTAGAEAVVSIPDQKIAVIQDGVTIREFRVSTSRYGVGDRFNSYATPLGELEVAEKVGQGAPLGAVFHNRQFTGEILHPNAPGRDPIVTRILCLRGLEACNANAYSRNIYIHGTPAEHLIGRPASYGCIRMRSRDVMALFDMLPVGGRVEISTLPLHRAIASRALPGQERFAAAGDESNRLAVNY